MNGSVKSKSAFYRAQHIAGEAVKDYTLESMGNAWVKSLDDVLLSGDGGYPIRRNSPHCSFDVMNVASNKIVELGSVYKKDFFI